MGLLDSIVGQVTGALEGSVPGGQVHPGLHGRRLVADDAGRRPAGAGRPVRAAGPGPPSCRRGWARRRTSPSRPTRCSRCWASRTSRPWRPSWACRRRTSPTSSPACCRTRVPQGNSVTPARRCGACRDATCWSDYALTNVLEIGCRHCAQSLTARWAKSRSLRRSTRTSPPGRRCRVAPTRRSSAPATGRHRLALARPSWCSDLEELRTLTASRVSPARCSSAGPASIRWKRACGSSRQPIARGNHRVPWAAPSRSRALAHERLHLAPERRGERDLGHPGVQLARRVRGLRRRPFERCQQHQQGVARAAASAAAETPPDCRVAAVPVGRPSMRGAWNTVGRQPRRAPRRRSARSCRTRAGAPNRHAWRPRTARSGLWRRRPLEVHLVGSAARAAD